MTNWFYYDSNGEKQGAVSGGQLKWLAKNGKITPGTLIETESGQMVPAVKIKGLTFAVPESMPSEPTLSESAQPVETEIYDSVVPPLEPSFPAISVPEAENTSIPVDVSVLKKDKHGRTKLHKAAEKNDTAQIAALIAAGANVNVKDTEEAATPLHYAASTDSAEAIVTLVKAGANVNLQDSKGNTPLHDAISTNSRKAITALIDAGADANIMGEGGDTPLLSAVLWMLDGALCDGIGNEEPTDSPSPAETGIQKALDAIIAASIGALIKAKANVDALDKDGLTGLHHAASRNTIAGIAVARILVQAGANINAKTTTHGDTPLHYAIDVNCSTTAEMLIDAGADINVQSKNGGTPLHVAAIRNSIAIARMLINAKTDVNVQNKTGKTPLDLAHNSPGVADLLKNAGAVYGRKFCPDDFLEDFVGDKEEWKTFRQTWAFVVIAGAGLLGALMGCGWYANEINPYEGHINEIWEWLVLFVIWGISIALIGGGSWGIYHYRTHPQDDFHRKCQWVAVALAIVVVIAVVVAIIAAMLSRHQEKKEEERKEKEAWRKWIDHWSNR